MSEASHQAEQGEGWLVHCRPGFESACAAELIEAAQAAGLPGVYAIARPGEAWLRLRNPLPDPTGRMYAACPARAIFARQIIHEWAWLEALPSSDRVGALVAALPRERDFSGLQISLPDSNEGKALSRLQRALDTPFRRGLEQAGIRLDVTGAPRLHLFLAEGGRAGLGINRHADDPAGGIRRLRLSPAAPSRSSLKLDEAFQVLLTAKERDRLLVPGATAVDLGAAPGGWTWQMLRRHIRVTAVDNGPMAASLMDSGLVHHVRADGFSWQPPTPVDWLLCDIVDSPSRVARRIAHWLRQGWARQAVFNLKLPMKQPWPVVRSLLDELTQALPGMELRARQLYHDREEITLIALPRAEPGTAARAAGRRKR